MVSTRIQGFESHFLCDLENKLEEVRYLSLTQQYHASTISQQYFLNYCPILFRLNYLVAIACPFNKTPNLIVKDGEWICQHAAELNSFAWLHLGSLPFRVADVLCLLLSATICHQEKNSLYLNDTHGYLEELEALRVKWFFGFEVCIVVAIPAVFCHITHANWIIHHAHVFRNES